MLVAPAGFQFYDYTALMDKLDKEIPELQKFIVLEDINGKYKSSGKAPKYVQYESYLQQFDADASKLPKVDISPHDMVNVQFTSGSTGLPKNVALSHYNIMNCGRYIWQQVRMTPEDRVCLPVPLFHSFGMIVGKSEFALAQLSLRLTGRRYQLEHCGRLGSSPSQRALQRQKGAGVCREIQVYSHVRRADNVRELHGARRLPENRPIEHQVS